jgi:hypothetical protein
MEMTPERIILAVIAICGILSHFFSPTSTLGKIFNVLGALTFRAAQVGDSNVKKLTNASIVFFVSFVVIGCQPAMKIWDTAYDTCVKALQVEPAVIAVADKKVVPYVEYAKGICNIAVVLNPFIEELNAIATGAKKADKPAKLRALQAAQEHGLLQ